MNMLRRAKLWCAFTYGEPCRVSDSDSVVWQRHDIASPVACFKKLHDMALLVLGGVVSYLVFCVINGEQILGWIKLTINFRNPRTWRTAI